MPGTNLYRRVFSQVPMTILDHTGQVPMTILDHTGPYRDDTQIKSNQIKRLYCTEYIVSIWACFTIKLNMILDHTGQVPMTILDHTGQVPMTILDHTGPYRDDTQIKSNQIKRLYCTEYIVSIWACFTIKLNMILDHTGQVPMTILDHTGQVPMTILDHTCHYRDDTGSHRSLP